MREESLWRRRTKTSWSYKKQVIPTGMTCFFGAGDEARTRYLHLGKVALYQMSYTRVVGRTKPARTVTLRLPCRSVVFPPTQPGLQGQRPCRSASLWSKHPRGAALNASFLVDDTGLEPVTSRTSSTNLCIDAFCGDRLFTFLFEVHCKLWRNQGDLQRKFTHVFFENSQEEGNIQQHSDNRNFHSSFSFVKFTYLYHISSFLLYAVTRGILRLFPQNFLKNFWRMSKT